MKKYDKPKIIFIQQQLDVLLTSDVVNDAYALWLE